MRCAIPIAVTLTVFACGAGDRGSTSGQPPSSNGSDASPGESSDSSAASADATAGDAGADGRIADAGRDAPATLNGPPPSSLPVGFARPDVGAPLTPIELAAATDELVALLKGTRYFDLIDERVHGWPESDPNHGFWYGTWWSGVTVTKQGGEVTYTHGANGADNNGLRTAPLLEGACYAHLMWGKAQTARLVRRIARGYSSEALAMKRDASDAAKPMLARAHYPANITFTDSGRTMHIDYALDRPGIDGTSEYVHLPANPTFGDIWVKNNRSKDDMGHVMRSIAQVQACVPRLDGAAQADLAQMRDLYAAWARQVEADGWGIATLDKTAQVTLPPIQQSLAHYTLIGNLECPGALMLRLLGDGNPGSLDCSNGISQAEILAGTQVKSSAKQILRTSHEGAVNMAFLTAQPGAGLPLLQGLAARVEGDLALVTQVNPPSSVNPSDIASLLVHAANAGVPLTSAEIRWLHGRLHLAHQTYLAQGAAPGYDVFNPATPDGAYPYEPGGDGLSFVEIGAMIGACASPYRNPAGRAIVDCARLLAAF